MTRCFLLLLALSLVPSVPAVEPAVTFGTMALRGKPDHSILAVAFSPDGSHVGTIDEIGSHFHALATGRGDATPYPNNLQAKDRVTVSPDGRKMIAIRTDFNGVFEVQTIDPNTGRPDNGRQLPGSTSEALASEDASFVAFEHGDTVSVDGVRRAISLGEVHNFTGLRRFSAAIDGATFAILSRHGDLRIGSNAGLWTPSAKPDHTYCGVAVSADGHFFATACYTEDDAGKKKTGPLELWSVKETKVVRTFDAVDWFGEYPNRLRFTPDGATLLAGDGAYIRGWSTMTGTKTFAAEPGWNFAGGLVVSPDSKRVAIAYPNRGIVYDLATGRMPEAFRGHAGPVQNLQFSRDGKYAVTSSYGRPEVFVWNAATGAIVAEVRADYAKPPPGGSIIRAAIAVRFSHDGTKILTMNDATGAVGPLRAWDVATGALLWEKAVADKYVPQIATLKTGVVYAPDQVPTLLDVSTGNPVWKLPEAWNYVGYQVASAGDAFAIHQVSRPIRVVTSDGTLRDTMPQREAIGFSPDGKRVFSLFSTKGPKDEARTTLTTRRLDKKADAADIPLLGDVTADLLTADAAYYAARREGVLAYDLRLVGNSRKFATCACIHDPMMAEGTPHTQFSPDGRLFAVAFGTGALDVFDVASGEIIVESAPPGIAKPFLAFTPDSRLLFTSSTGDPGGPVLGYDTTGRRDRMAKWPPEIIKTLTADLGGKPAAARRAVYELSTMPEAAIPLAKSLLALPTEADLSIYEAWLGNLSAPAFAQREAATKGLAAAGWRVEAKLRTALAAAEDAESRQRLEVLLAKPDHRPARAVHLLELVGTPAAVAVLVDLAAGPASVFAVIEAKRALERLNTREPQR